MGGPSPLPLGRNARLHQQGKSDIIREEQTHHCFSSSGPPLKRAGGEAFPWLGRWGATDGKVFLKGWSSKTQKVFGAPSYCCRFPRGLELEPGRKAGAEGMLLKWCGEFLLFTSLPTFAAFPRWLHTRLGLSRGLRVRPDPGPPLFPPPLPSRGVLPW